MLVSLYSLFKPRHKALLGAQLANPPEIGQIQNVSRQVGMVPLVTFSVSIDSQLLVRTQCQNNTVCLSFHAAMTVSTRRPILVTTVSTM